MYATIVPQVLEKYGITYTRVGQPQKGYRSESYAVHTKNSDVLNLIFFKKEPHILPRINRADHASLIAHGAGLPVRIRYDDRILRVKEDTYAGIYTYLPGQSLPWEAYTKKHIKILGIAMADLHRAWRDASPSDAYHVRDELLPLLDRMEAYFADENVRTAMHAKLLVTLHSDFDDYRKVVTHVSSLADQQIVHMDMVRGNILFGGAAQDDRWRIDDIALTGVLDFEKSALGHPVFDVARTLAFLLVDSPKPHSKIYQYFLDSGYVKRGGASLPDSRLLTPLIRLFLLHDFYKFLRHTPYESLHLNHHYRQTCDLLLGYGMIESKK